LEIRGLKLFHRRLLLVFNNHLNVVEGRYRPLSRFNELRCLTV
jgi:hypothetical protein